MRKYILSLLCLVMAADLVAVEPLVNGLLFPDFATAVIRMKNGSVVQSKLNYDTLEEEMLFLDDNGLIMAVSTPEDIDFVVIGKRPLVCIADGVFYEQVNAGENVFFVRWKSKMISEGRKTAYGGYTNTSAVQNVGVLYNGGSRSSISMNERFRMNPEIIYYLRSGSSYKRFDSARTLARRFKGLEAEIQKYADDLKIDFETPADVARLVEYCYTITK